MKRILLTVLALCMCFGTVAALTACKHDHVSTTAWTGDDTDHWHKCDECEEQLDKAAHTWGDAVKVSHGTYKYTCTTCQREKTENSETTVTADQFTAAFSLGTNYTVVVDATHPTQGSYHSVDMRDGNKYSSAETMTAPNGEKNESRDFSAIEGEDCYYYNVSYDDNGNLTSCTRSKSDQTVDEFVSSKESYFLPSFLRDFTKFTYDAESKLYVAATISERITEAKLGFEDGKIVSFSYVNTMNDGSEVPYSFTFTYGTAAVTLPELTAQ